jgi:hypothetical protein
MEVSHSCTKNTELSTKPGTSPARRSNTDVQLSKLRIDMTEDGCSATSLKRTGSCLHRPVLNPKLSNFTSSQLPILSCHCELINLTSNRPELASYKTFYLQDRKEGNYRQGTHQNDDSKKQVDKMFESGEHSGGCFNSPKSANTENQSPITINCKNVHSCIIISSFGKHSVYHYDCRLQPVNCRLLTNE